MTACRALPLVALIVIVALPLEAGAQPGGVPGEGHVGAPPTGMPPACQRLVAMRGEVQKHGQAIQKAHERKAPVQEACRLFKSYLSAEQKFLQGIEENARTCGVPPEVLKQVKESHAKASQIGKEVCEAAAQGPRPAGPSLSDALGTNPTLPSMTDGGSSKRGGTTFDTLNGNVLSR